MEKTELGSSGPKTFTRGLRIMDVLYQAGENGLTIPEIAARAQIQRSTVYRFLDVLLQQNFVFEEGASRRFVFNYERLQRKPDTAWQIDRLKPALKRISMLTGNSTFLVRREGGDSLCEHREVGSYPVQVLTVTVGYRQPLGVGAAGLALLSSLSAEDIDLILTANKDVLPLYGGMTVSRMRKLIRNTQERGWSAVGNAAVPGVLGVGVPVLISRGRPTFGVSVSSTIERMPLATQRSIVEIIHAELESL